MMNAKRINQQMWYLNKKVNKMPKGMFSIVESNMAAEMKIYAVEAVCKEKISEHSYWKEISKEILKGLMRIKGWRWKDCDNRVYRTHQERKEEYNYEQAMNEEEEMLLNK